MKKPILSFYGVIAIIATGFLLIAGLNQLTTQKAVTEVHLEEEDEGKEEQSGAARQLNGWYQAKAYPNPENLSSKYQDAWQDYLEIKKNTQQSLSQSLSLDGVLSNWTGLGYCSDGGTRIGGRVVCMAIDPNNTNNLWVGSASGGIWKSTDAGANWVSVPTNLPVLGVSSILVDPSNSNIIYAGTGEVYHTEVDVMGFNVWKTRGTYGIGVIKSINGGTSWTQVMPKVSSDLFAISSMAFLPGNSSTIFACATDGVYRSVNSGSTWTKIYIGINVRDIAIHPTSTDIMVISVGNMTNAVKGIFRTTNGSNASPTWTQITSGLPSSYAGSIKLDNADASILAASIGVSSGSSNEVYRSTDFGTTWSVLSTSNHCSYQFWFAHTIAVNPFFSDSLIYGGVGIYRHRTIATVGRASISGLHADHHDVKFDPVRRGTVYVCNDGGVYKSTNGGVSFSAINNGLNATQFYASLGVSKSNANLMVGGLQDNGQVVYNGTNWIAPGGAGGDGTACAIHPTNNNILLACRDARAIKRSTDGGANFSELSGSYWGFVGDSRTAFVAPIAFAPSDGSIAYQASDNIHRSTNSGGSFTNNTLGSGSPATTPGAFIEARHKTAIALAISHTNPNKLYVSTSPFAQYDNDANNIYVTGQPNILRTTTGGTPFTSVKGTLPDRFVMDIAISPNSDDSVYVVLGGFGTSHVYLTPDGGTTWLSRGSGLPDVPFNAILIDPTNPKIIYAGSDFGVYVSHNRGINWYAYNTGFNDATLIMDLQVDANNKLIAATHGKGVFRSDLFTPPITLPVTFTAFTGQNVNDANQLKWDVVEEYNLSHYEIERSVDGFNFQRIANANARNSTAASSYYHTDNIRTIATSSFYYRLKAINTDGTYFYSDIIQIKIANKSGFKIIGNPITSQISFRYNATEAGTMKLRLLDQQGRAIRSEQQQVATGTAYYTMNNLSSLPAGMYILEMWINKERYTEKILKR
ncbi:hypothetical protein CAP36_17070 [Chitinophagaceae bacterium IBVUCB2]|nr:hypothetical protein CAP36_17070 [Chitinophagaceae bacterium IBVUCB2]